MKLYSKKYKRYVERQIHFGIGASVDTACGITLFSRQVMVNLHSSSDGLVIVDDINRVTCKRCLASRDLKIKRLLDINNLLPGIFDRESLCGRDWLLNHALDVSRVVIDKQKMVIADSGKQIQILNNIKAKDMKYLMRNFVKQNKE